MQAVLLIRTVILQKFGLSADTQKMYRKNEGECMVSVWEANMWRVQIFDMDKIQISSLNGSPGPNDT